LFVLTRLFDFVGRRAEQRDCSSCAAIRDVYFVAGWIEVNLEDEADIAVRRPFVGKTIGGNIDLLKLLETRTTSWMCNRLWVSGQSITAHELTTFTWNHPRGEQRAAEADQLRGRP
jgi:hypothetical protein